MLHTVSVPVRAIAGSARMSVGEACGLAVGRCILLDVDASGRITLMVGAQDIAHGTLMTCDTSKADGTLKTGGTLHDTSHAVRQSEPPRIAITIR